MGTLYEIDVVAWAKEQAELLRTGRLSEIDIENIAEEIISVGISENRELKNRMALLLAHLLKWKFQQCLQCKSWRYTIKNQRKEVADVLEEAPSLRTKFSEAKWADLVWAKAKDQAAKETGLDIDHFPDTCPWTIDNILSEDWLPE